MKKLIYCALALAAGLFASSCQQENLEPVQGGTTVTYTVEMPQVATKAVGEADYVNKLVYAVYRVLDTNLTDKEAKENLATNSGNYQLMYQEDTPVTTVEGKKKAHISLELINDQRYVVIFWAQKDYTWFNEGQSFTSVAYPATLDGNNDAYDAFTGVDVITVDRPISKDITLVRPFAQLNIATVVPGPTTEYPDRYTDFQVATTGVVVTGVAQSFNVGAQVGETVGEVSFTDAAPVNQRFNDTYPAYVSMNYVFVPANQSNVTVSYDINTNNYGTVENTVPNVPLARNYRTNIIGNLLTSEVDYNVELAPWYENSNSGTTEVIVDGLVKNQNGDYEVYTAVGLAHAINHHFVNAEGVANPGTFYIKPGIYDMAQQAIKDVTVTSGTLKVYGTEALVTRSASINNVIITGLNKAMINTVDEGATVFFSGITIKDFEGESNAAALVQDNSGKVVLAGCDIVDENGNPDMDTELVGGNDPVEVEKGEEAATDLIYTAEQLAAAFADETVESIVLGADIALENTLVFPEGRTATLDLRGWELTIADPDKVATTYALNNHGTLTIKDSYATGSVNARGIYNGFVDGGENISTATLTIKGGTFNALGTNGGAAVFNYGIAEINGGNFTSIGGYSLNNQSGASMTIADGVMANNGIYNTGATLTINGGNIEGNRSGCHVVYSWNSTVTINGGTIHNNNSGNSTLMSAGTSVMTVNAGTFSIKDGRVEGNGNTWTSCLTDTQNTARLTINGGTFNGGFRVQGGTTMEITDGIFNDVVGSGYNVYEGATVVITGGSYNYDVNKWCHKDYKAVKNAETALWDVVEKVYVVKVTEEEKYESIQDAVDAAEASATITFLTDITQEDGVLITDKNLTIDLNGKTFTVSEGGSTNNRNFKVNGSSVVTIKNGTMVADGELTSGAYGTVRTEDSANVTLNNVKSYSYRGYGLNIKANTGTTITINDSEIYAQYSGGVEAAGGEIVLNNVKITQEGVYSSGAWCSVAIGVNGGGKVTVNSGEYSAAAIATDSNAAQGTWVAYVMNSGGTLEINGGTFNGTVAETAAAANACGLICADTKAVVNIYDGTFNSNGAILDMRNNTGGSPNPVATLNGGTFSADPTVSGLYGSNLISVVEGYEVYQEDDLWKVGEEGIRSWAEFTEALAADETEFKLQADITYDGNYQLQKAVTIDLNEKSMTLQMINIHTKTTVKNGTINGKVYARKNAEVVLENITFSGNVSDNLSTEGHLAIQGGCKSLYAKDCLFSPTSVSGSQTKPLSFEGGSSILKFENCEFKSSPYKKQVYLNSLSATGTIDFTNCNFNNKTPNIMFAAACPFTNVTMSGTTKLGSVTFETNRAKDAVTEDDLAYLRTLIANNSISSVRLFYAGGSSEYIR